MNQLVITFAKMDTCSVCNNERRVLVDLVHYNQQGMVECPLCRNPEALGVWLAPFLEAGPA